MDCKRMERLCTAFGVSGAENKISDLLRAEILCDESYTDGAGNLFALKKSKAENAPTVMLDAHMDTVGLMVKEVLQNGFLKFAPVGGVDPKILPGAVVQAQNGVVGVIATKPPHLMDEKDKENIIPLADMVIDTGDNAIHLQVGDRFGYYPRFADMESCISATYLDNRLGCGLILEVFARLQNQDLPFHLLACFSRGEESGLKGIQSAQLQADLALVLDVTFGKRQNELSDEALQMGGGVAIGVGPNLHKQLSFDLFETAKKCNIPHQTEVLEYTGTNAWALQLANQGIACGMLSVPILYMHTPVELVKKQDFDHTADLIEQYLLHLSPQQIREISGVTELC